MGGARAESISIGQLTEKLTSAVESALKNNPNFRSEKPKVSFFPDPGIVGFVLQDPEISAKTLAEVGKLTADITAQMSGLHSASAMVLRDHGPIVGFFPAAEIALRE